MYVWCPCFAILGSNTSHAVAAAVTRRLVFFCGARHSQSAMFLMWVWPWQSQWSVFLTFILWCAMRRRSLLANVGRVRPLLGAPYRKYVEYTNKVLPICPVQCTPASLSVHKEGAGEQRNISYWINLAKRLRLGQGGEIYHTSSVLFINYLTYRSTHEIRTTQVKQLAAVITSFIGSRTIDDSGLWKVDLVH